MRISAVIAGIGGLVVAALGLRILLADGSYFQGEASVVLSLDGLSALETFQGKLLGGGQNFPRIYLLAIRGVRELLGTSTWATRLLPELFFLAATALWMRLLFLRFRERPLLVLLGVLLPAAVPTWLIYGAAVKYRRDEEEDSRRRCGCVPSQARALARRDDATQSEIDRSRRGGKRLSPTLYSRPLRSRQDAAR